MEIEGLVHRIGDIEIKGNDFKIAEVILDRKNHYQGKDYPNFTKVTLQGDKTTLLEERNLLVGDYIKTKGDLRGRFFEHNSEEKFAQDFVIWDIEILRKNTEENKSKENAFMGKS